MGAKLVIPSHFEMFEFNTAASDEFIEECQKLAQPFKMLRCGEQWHSQGRGFSVRDDAAGDRPIAVCGQSPVSRLPSNESPGGRFSLRILDKPPRQAYKKL